MIARRGRLYLDKAIFNGSRGWSMHGYRGTSNTALLSSSTFDREGGIQRVTQMVLRFLHEELVEPSVDLFSLHDASAEADYHLVQMGEEERRDWIRHYAFASSRSRYVTAVIHTLHLRRPGLVIIDHAHLSLLPRLAFPVGGPPRVAFVYHAELPNLSVLRRWALRNFDVIVAISEFAASEAQRVLGTDCPIALCRLGLYPDYEKWAQNPAPTPTRMVGRRNILIVGRMADGSRDKGHATLIRAMPAVIAQVPNALLTIVGRGADEPRIRRLVIELGLQQHVFFAGYVPDAELPAFHQAAEMFAMPSHGEGFGLVYLEAMYHAKPCIAGNRDAAREVVSDGETGILVTPGNVAEHQVAILRLLSDQALAIRMGAAGQERLQRKFLYRNFVHRLRQALVDLPAGLLRR